MNAVHGRPLKRQPAGHEPSLASRLGLAGDHQAYFGSLRQLDAILDSFEAMDCALAEADEILRDIKANHL
jgi:hypothetical protein